ncbi:hypothetical protein [Paenibacillus sp. UNC451MF]|uniref:hypothetical protein n=1 Tax=Paenibacillus sp. UNC451MF TaxID=1449063 RepID=UPI00048B6AC2|nr:hypothetical protein [Paenibacillus sp. UNC451MF]
MSLRPVELQFVLHKNDEAGLKQNQLNQKPVQDQALLADDALKHTEKERHLTGKSENPHKATLFEKDKEKSEHQNKKSPRKKESASSSSTHPEKSEHPFKGKHIDYSL